MKSRGDITRGVALSRHCVLSFCNAWPAALHWSTSLRRRCCPNLRPTRSCGCRRCKATTRLRPRRWNARATCAASRGRSDPRRPAAAAAGPSCWPGRRQSSAARAAGRDARDGRLELARQPDGAAGGAVSSNQRTLDDLLTALREGELPSGNWARSAVLVAAARWPLTAPRAPTTEAAVAPSPTGPGREFRGPRPAHHHRHARCPAGAARRASGCRAPGDGRDGDAGHRCAVTYRPASGPTRRWPRRRRRPVPDNVDTVDKPAARERPKIHAAAGRTRRQRRSTVVVGRTGQPTIHRRPPLA